MVVREEERRGKLPACRWVINLDKPTYSVGECDGLAVCRYGVEISRRYASLFDLLAKLEVVLKDLSHHRVFLLLYELFFHLTLECVNRSDMNRWC